MRPCARRRRSRAATLLLSVVVAGAPDAGAAARGPSRRRRTTGCPDGKISVTLQSGATICSRDTTKPCPDGKISVTLRSGANICSRSRHHARIDPARSPGAHGAVSSGGGAPDTRPPPSASVAATPSSPPPPRSAPASAGPRGDGVLLDAAPVAVAAGSGGGDGGVALPDAGAARGGRGSAETNASSAASARHKAPRGSIVSIIYAGHACRRQHTLPNVWDNNRRNLIEPLARKYDPVRLFGWFEPDPPACDDTKTKYGTHATICACHAAIARLPWTDYTFSDGGNASEVRPRTNAPEAAAKNFAEALRKAKTGSAPWESVGPFRRYAAIATWVAADLDRHAFVVVTRPDLWFRQPIDAWDLDLSKDLNLPHRECPGLSCGHGGRGMAPESFYVISTRWVRIMLDLPLGDRFLGRFSWTPPQGAVLVEERHRGPRIAHEASIHVVAWRGRCCANTRSDKWHPLLAIGIQCCVYLRDCRDWRLDPGVEERDPQKYLPSCFWDKSRARLALSSGASGGCDVSRFLASPQIANRSWNAAHYTRPPDQPPMCQPWSLPPGLP